VLSAGAGVVVHASAGKLEFPLVAMYSFLQYCDIIQGGGGGKSADSRPERHACIAIACKLLAEQQEVMLA
jgi:hypothetical protein